MNRFGCRMGPLFALVVVAGCSGEPTDSFREGVNLRAVPSQLFIEAGETETVIVSAVDNQGNPLTFNYEVTQTGAGIAVRRDSSFLPIYVDDSTLAVPPEGERFQFIVVGNAYSNSSFTVSAGGEELTIPVQVVPQNGITATFSNPTPALGEQVVITAPAGTRFTAESEVTLPGAPVQPVTVAVAGDGTTITALFPPNVAAPVTITNVVSDGAPTQTFNPATTDPINTPVIDSFPATLSSATPAGNEPVTLTITDPSFTFAPDAAVIVGTDTALTLSVAPDGSSITFLPTPGASGSLSGSGVQAGGFAIGLPVQGATITVGLPAALAGTDDINTAPTITVPATGGVTQVYDASTFTGADITDDGGVSAQYYELSAAAESTVEIFLSSNNAAPDLDIVICDDTSCTNQDFSGASTAHDEHIEEIVLPAGTSYLAVVNFDGGASDFISIQIIGH